MWEEWWKDSWFLGDPCNGFCCATQQRNPTPHKVSSPSAEDCPLPGAAKGHSWNVSCGPLYFALSFFQLPGYMERKLDPKFAAPACISGWSHSFLIILQSSCLLVNNDEYVWNLCGLLLLQSPVLSRNLHYLLRGQKAVEQRRHTIWACHTTICCGGQSSWYRSESERVLPSLWVERKIWTRIHVFFLTTNCSNYRIL